MRAVVGRRIGLWALGALAFALTVSVAPHALAQCKQATTGYCVAAGAACAPPAAGKCVNVYGQPPFRRPHCVCGAPSVSTHPSACKQGCQTQYTKCEHQPLVVGQVAKCQHALQACEKSCG